jgi:hypothetical protein
VSLPDETQGLELRGLSFRFSNFHSVRLVIDSLTASLSAHDRVCLRLTLHDLENEVLALTVEDRELPSHDLEHV